MKCSSVRSNLSKNVMFPQDDLLLLFYIFVALGVADCLRFFFFSPFLVKRFREPKHERRPWRIWYVSACFILKFFCFLCVLEIEGMIVCIWWLKKSDDNKSVTDSEEQKTLPKYMSQWKVTFCVFPCWFFLTEHLQKSLQSRHKASSCASSWRWKLTVALSCIEHLQTYISL